MNTTRYHFYTRFERMWHWCQAIAIGLLMLTGLALHAPERLGWLPFPTAVAMHNVLGFVLIINAFLGLFYYVATGTIRQHLPQPGDFLSLAARQAMFYLNGMFRGAPHPLKKVPTRRLNPLQQVTYLTILNVLLPLQATTGVLMWSAQRWPNAVASMGGLAPLAMIHTLGAWLFGAFFVMHIYLTTTGLTPLTNLKTMVLGYEALPIEENARERTP
jgi:thiosulfate reductase cytochrome b subunit